MFGAEFRVKLKYDGSVFMLEDRLHATRSRGEARAPVKVLHLL